MPNAWFYYVLPLIISAVFIVAGLKILRGVVQAGSSARENKIKPISRYFGGVILLIGLGVVAATLFNSPTPWARQEIFKHILRTPPDQIDRFVIKAGRPGEPRSLTKKEIVVDDSVRIRQIAAILSSGREVSPNHPRTRWSTGVKMDTRSGTYHFRVIATEPGDRNGTLVNVATRTEGGWNLGDVRADGLERVLKAVVKGGGTDDALGKGE
jgi:hypothetical protein